ncbi:MAG: apolipoprotein N-acyltransferase [Desulfuromonadaceae bacterium]|nr:apolipoprotein N-acyltransferase [Desulfuromonadaceae bacterium]
MKVRSDILAPLLSGLLMALAFPHTLPVVDSPALEAACGGLAWVGLVPLFVVFSRRPARSGFLAGLAFFAPMLYWLNLVMTTFGHLPWLLALGCYLLLVAYLALFWAGACWCSWHIHQRLGLSLYLVLPVVWVSFAWLRSHLFTGFPWAILSYSQAALPSLIQSVDLAGIWLPLFLLVLVNSVLAGLWQRCRGTGSCPTATLMLVLVLWLSNWGYGLWAQQQDWSAGGDALRVALVQGNIDQQVKWQASHLEETLLRYEQLSSVAHQPQLLVWPESATPFFYQDGGRRTRRVRFVAQDGQAQLLFGSPAWQRQGDRYRYLNSAYLLSAKGEDLGRSDKIHLVPFGEYVPLSGLLSFVDKLAEGIGDFVPGKLALLPAGGVPSGVLICYEAIFSELAREQVRHGAALLFNLTNDAWFGNSSAPWQHLDMARFRSIEQRRWLARCANTGFSALISPTGEVTTRSALFEATVIEGEIVPAHIQTLYARLGDKPVWGLVVVTLLWLWQSRRKPLSA